MRKPTLIHRAEYLGVKIFVRTVRVFPAGFALRLAGLAGTLVFDVVRYRRSVALSNLKRHLETCVPEAGRGRRGIGYSRIGRESCRNLIMGLAEFARMPLVDSQYIKRHIQIDGLENLDRALASGKGAILVTGHFGSWELTGCVLARLGYPMSYLVGIQRNPLVQQLMDDIRSSCGIAIIEPHRLLAVPKSLKSNHFVAMLSDQDAGRKGVFVEFLGEPASTPRGAAHLSILAGCPIIPGFIVRTTGLGHRIVIEKPIYPPEAPGEAALRELTQAYSRVIESYVRQHPGQWLWTHRRWKTRPA
ncbi:MAG: lysophospholipid acyltransferase family protein [Candidatus Eisenbacteria bacterium]